MIRSLSLSLSLSLVLFMFHDCVCNAVVSVPCSLMITRGERGDLLALLSVYFLVFCHFIIWCSGSGKILDCIHS